MSNDIAKSIDALNNNINKLSSELSRLGNRINELISLQREMMGELKKVISELEDEVGNLRRTIVNVELTKLRGKLQHLRDYLETINDIKEEVEARYLTEYKRVKEAYSQSVLNIFKKFMEAVKRGEVSTTPLLNILESYNRLKELKNRVIEWISELSKNHLKVYEQRIENLSKTKEEVLDKMSEFIEYRRKIVEEINALKLDIHSDHPLVVNIPFWIVGIKIDGSERTLIIPPSERKKSDKHPTEETPYVEHLVVPKEVDFSELIKELEKPEIVKFAKSVSIKPEKSMLISGLKDLKNRGYINDVFIEAVERFWR